MILRLAALSAAVALGPVPSCGGGGTWDRPDCFPSIGYTANGYGVREIDCVRGPGTMVATWDCVRDGRTVSRPMARQRWSTTATFAATCWDATPVRLTVTP